MKNGHHDGSDRINGKADAHLNGDGHRPDDAAGRPRPLSEISHLFLSGLRDGQSNGPRPGPDRRPPAASSETVDLTPGEFAGRPARPGSEGVPVRIVVGTRLGRSLVRRACEWSAGLAGRGASGVVAVAVAEPWGLRLLGVRLGQDEGDDAAPEVINDAACLSRALADVSCDVDAWVIVVPDPKSGVGRDVLARLHGRASWVLLTTADHEGVVSGYKTLKGLADAASPDAASPVTLAFVEAADPAEARRCARKLAGVCRQFLNVEVTAEPAASSPAEWSVLDLAVAPWVDGTAAAGGVEALAGVLRDVAPAVSDPPATPAEASYPVAVPPLAAPLPPKPVQASSSAPAPAGPARRLVGSFAWPDPADEPAATPARARPPADLSVDDEVLDLPPSGGVIDAALAGLFGRGLAVTPVTPPTLPAARVVVDRTGGLVLLAACEPGLGDVPAVWRALAWAGENRPLLAMALSQWKFDASAEVKLHLLVHHADARADALSPLTSTGRVTVTAYRKVNWAGRQGLLLDAA